ncbi:hypothetical protein DAEQUDRAFT_679619, partial [Daedalea quercina L-15889]
LRNNFDVYSILCVNFMHEVELGTWKAMFTHLVCILYATKPSGSLADELDQRLKHYNVSDMSQMAARDFKNLLLVCIQHALSVHGSTSLQVAILTFEELLLQRYNEMLLTILYQFAEWHALVNLRMHMDSSLEHWCKTFNADTYKVHSTGDIPNSVVFLGTLDSYTTQMGEFCHRSPKQLYKSGNKNNAAKQIMLRERRKTFMCCLNESLSGSTAGSSQDHGIQQPASGCLTFDRPLHPHHVQFHDSEPLPYTDPYMHHHISSTTGFPEHIYGFIQDLGIDPAGTDFMPKLKKHLLLHLRGTAYDDNEEEFTADELCSQIRINKNTIKNTIYSHKVLRVNYTTYDGHHSQDLMNPQTHCDVMVHASDKGDHPYWYAHVLGIFHADLLHTDLRAKNHSLQWMEFLWVRWFGLEPERHFGHDIAHFPRVGFVEETDKDAFSSLDPSLVICSCYLAPAFALAKTSELLCYANSVARPISETEDWKSYYVIM